MASRLDRTLKLVWLVIGSLLLLGLVIALVASVASFLTSGGGGAESAAIPAAGEASPRQVLPVRFGLPKPIPGTPLRVVELRAAERDVDEDGSAYSARTGGDYALVNLAFLAPDGSARLLLDRPARIESVDYPPADTGPARGWIAYRIAFQDTNGDGRLTFSDRAELYASALDGSGFRRVLPSGMRALAHAPHAEGRQMLVLALATPGDTALPQERWSQRALVFDPATGIVRPLGSLDSLAARAERIIRSR